MGRKASDELMQNAGIQQLLENVRRRLWLRRALVLVSRNLLVALLLILPPAVLAAFNTNGVVPAAGALLCGMMGIACAAAITQAAFSRPSLLDAALFIDAKLNLQERISTLAAMPASQVPESIYRALAADASAHAEGIHPAAVCPISIPRSAPITGIVLFCTAVLIFGSAEHGNAGRPPVAENEVQKMLTAKSYVQVELAPEMSAELAKVAGSGNTDLDSAVSRLDDLLAEFQALDGIKQSIEPREPGDLSADAIKQAIENTADAKKRLEAVLGRAAEALQADEALKKAADDALAALATGADDALAASLAKLAAELSARTAEHRLDRLKSLKGELTALKQSAEQEPGFQQGVTRVLIAGAKPTEAAPDDPSLPLFPPDAAVKAKAAVDTGKAPAKYRWVVERYFSEDVVR